LFGNISIFYFTLFSSQQQKKTVPRYKNIGGIFPPPCTPRVTLCCREGPIHEVYLAFSELVFEVNDDSIGSLSMRGIERNLHIIRLTIHYTGQHC
jgi:hypothetical protein